MVDDLRDRLLPALHRRRTGVNPLADGSAGCAFGGHDLFTVASSFTHRLGMVVPLRRRLRWRNQGT